MTILVLEDDNRRFALIRRALPHQHVVRAETANEAIQLLQEQEFEFVMLDHDLCDEHYELYQVKAFGGTDWVPRQATGMRVVDHLVDNQVPIRAVLVHSLNNVEAPEMVKRLQEAGYLSSWAPNCWNKCLNIVDEMILPL